ncbi:hypothetical protein L7F22_016351 [Adiantum nelumboides]|nr:hypothetical protein [Adiantum nelumboides]
MMIPLGRSLSQRRKGFTTANTQKNQKQYTDEAKDDKVASVKDTMIESKNISKEVKMSKIASSLLKDVVHKRDDVSGKEGEEESFNKDCGLFTITKKFVLKWDLLDGMMRRLEVALKAEYFLEDSQRVTKQTFIKWVQMKNKGLTSRELLQEFEKKFDQLSTGEQQSLRCEKVELFVQAVDSRLQKSLVQLLEDPAGELGLTNDWDAVPAAINLLVKRQKRIDKSIVVDSHEDFEENGIVEKIVEKPKASSSPTLEGKEKPKATQTSTLDDSTMDDLIKGIQELNLNLKAVRLEKSSSSEKPKDLRPELCIWCDSNDHVRKDCDDFNDAFSKNVVFWKDRKIHLTQIGQPLSTNFGRGGMKKIVGEMTSTASTYAMQVYKDENEEEVKASTNLWPHALRTAKAGKVTSFTLRQTGDSIRETTRWMDLVDSLLVYAYIAKAQANEAFVKDKRKREDEAPETSKRQTQANTRSDGERMQNLTPIPEVQMEDASKDKKQSKVRGPSYKLRSDIELATNLKKVFEERILNSKVEMTLGDILGIAKQELHEEIIDIIKRKRHVLVEQETNPTNSQNILHEELEDLEEPRARMENDVVLKAKHAHFHEDEESDEVPRSHFLRSHWARATTETVVKIADFEEPILALVDHGLEINLMSMTLYQKGKWPIDLDHGWRIRAANTQPGFLYGAFWSPYEQIRTYFTI